MKKRKEIYKDFKLEYFEEGGKTKTRVVYSGDYFVLQNSLAFLKKARLEISIYSLVISVFLFGSLFFDTVSGFKLYVVIPQFLSFVMGLITLYFFYPFLAGLIRYNSKQKEDVFVAPKGYFIAQASLIVFTVVARIVMMVIERNTYSISLEMILLFLCILCFVGLIRELFIFQKLHLVKEERLENIEEKTE